MVDVKNESNYFKMILFEISSYNKNPNNIQLLYR
jgi:hypothetical protein